MVPSKVCLAVKKVRLDIEWTILCEKDQLCGFTIFPVAWWVLCRSRFGDSQFGANRSFGYGGKESDGAACINFYISVHNMPPTNQNIFSLLEQIKSVHKILLLVAVTMCGVFLLMERNGSSGNIIESLSFGPLSCFSIILILTI